MNAIVNVVLTCGSTLLRSVCFGVISFALFSNSATAANISWNLAGGSNWDTTSNNWTGDATQYTDGGVDNVTFAQTGGGTITVQGGGVTPLSTTVSASSGTYTFAGGTIGGSGGLLKSGGGTLAIGSAYTGLDYTGVTQIDGGVLQIAHNSAGGDPSDRSLGGSVTLNGGTLRFHHTGAGHFGPTVNFTNPITVTAAGGTIDFTGAANNFINTFGPLTLGGNLTVSGVTGNSGIRYNFTTGGVTLTANSTITNATGPTNSHTISLNPNITGAAFTLDLNKTGSGTGYRIDGATSTSINVAGLNVGAGSSLYLSSGNSINPLSQIKLNGGMLNMGVGSSLSFQGSLAANGPIYDTSAVAWQGGGTLTFARDPGGNQDTYVRISNGNLEVSTASGLTTLNAEPRRAYLTIDSPHALVIGNGGTLNWTVGSNVRETVRGNMTFQNGATIVGINSGGNPGGIIRDTTGGGTLTLGNGSASVITVQGNHGADTDSFNMGFAANVTDNGNVTMKYANTSSNASDFFNIGWGNGGSQFSAPLTAFFESSAGTDFAPVVGSGGVAVVGADTGIVATFSNSTVISTAGTVGFYNEVNTNQRGALGNVVFQGDLSGIGELEAATTTFDGGSLSPGLSGAGTLSIVGNLVLGNTTQLNFDLNQSGIAGSGINDLISVTGNVTLDGVLNFSEVPNSGTYTLLTYTGSLTNNLLDVPVNAVLDFSTSGVVLLTYTAPVPEPSSFLLLGLGLLGVIRQARRRSR